MILPMIDYTYMYGVRKNISLFVVLLFCSTILNLLDRCAGSFHVSIIHRTLIWTMYRIFNVHTWFIVMHAYVHTEVGHADSKSAQDFGVKKPTNFPCAPDGVRTWGLRILTHYHFSHPTTLLTCVQLVHSVHMKGGQAQTSLQQSCLGVTELAHPAPPGDQT